MRKCSKVTGCWERPNRAIKGRCRRERVLVGVRIWMLGVSYCTIVTLSRNPSGREETGDQIIWKSVDHSLDCRGNRLLFSLLWTPVGAFTFSMPIPRRFQSYPSILLEYSFKKFHPSFFFTFLYYSASCKIFIKKKIYIYIMSVINGWHTRIDIWVVGHKNHEGMDFPPSIFLRVDHLAHLGLTEASKVT